MRHFTDILTITMCAMVLCGCASTSIETPIGTYRSTRDAQLDELWITIEKHPDGSERTEVVAGGAKGEASPVTEAHASLVHAVFRAALEWGAAR